MVCLNELKNDVNNFIKSQFGKTINQATDYEKYVGVSKAVLNSIVKNWEGTKEAYCQTKQAAYLSAEYLMGRVLSNNLVNINIYNEVNELVKELGINYNILEDMEEDAGLGNGGLGRLAAGFMDSCATLNMPVTGYGIFYNFGLFTQKIINGFQEEEIDNWLDNDHHPWYIRKVDESIIVEYNDYKVRAVPYDTPIIGYGTKNINTLRLWQAEALNDFNFEYFNEQDYINAMRLKNEVENISRVLYPNDSKEEGKILRLRQQYFFVSASLQEMVNQYKKVHGNNLSEFHKYYAIQLNDTHPVVAIPELMRIFTEEEEMSWRDAWNVVTKTFAYTNHTILAEALEQWDTNIFMRIIPKILTIIEMIANQFEIELRDRNYDNNILNALRIIDNNRIRMAHLAIYGSSAINGVAWLHTEILKNQELKDWYVLYPEKFQNKTNGITPRRWLVLANPDLKKLITDLLGSEEWIKNLDLLKGLEKYANDESILNKFLEIKQKRKIKLVNYIKDVENVQLDYNSIFDIQIKRLHEYKRQLLNAFYILDLYYRTKDNPELDVVPHSFIFGGKAFPGYYRAKAIIKFINEIAKLINNDPDINHKIRVVFVNNYNVSYAQKLIPAADVSVQISTAGKEASGTGNMKFMLNGAVTFGTYDGANIEIVQEAGEENNFIFGARFEELERIKYDYNPREYYDNVEGLKRVVDSLVDGTFDDNGTGMFRELYESLLVGKNWHRADQYFLLKDFESYRETQNKIDEAYKDRIGWARKCWYNIANAGKFSSDRTISQYCNEIWHVKPTKIN